MAKNNRKEMSVFGGSGGFIDVSSQFYIVYTYDSHHTKGEPWKSFMKAVACYIKVLNMTASASIFFEGVYAQARSNEVYHLPAVNERFF